ncbi:MAG: hypothetical protein LC104_11700 [Bacteroidales bacterium]|nr:hypothetical protein [Bacteroidales bacterium]
MQRFPRRLPANDTQLNRMAWQPSYRAPALAEVQTGIALMPTTNLPELLVRWSAEDLVWENGQPVAMSLSGRAWIAGGAALCAAAPIRAIRLVAVQPFLEEVAACPHLRLVEHLDLTGNRIGPAGLQSLLASPWLGNLRRLDLERNDLGEAGAECLLTHAPPRLEQIRVTICEFSSATRLTLAARFGTITR